MTTRSSHDSAIFALGTDKCPWINVDNHEIEFQTSERTHKRRVRYEIAVDCGTFGMDTSMPLAGFVAKDAARMLGSTWKTSLFSWVRGAGSSNGNGIG